MRFLCSKLLALSGLLFLTACSTNSSTPNGLDKQDKIKTAKINAQLGLAYLEQHNNQRAKVKLLLALNQAPTIPEPWYSMAYYLEATGDKAGANKYYQKAIEVAPNRGDAHNNYGTYLCRSGQYQSAVQQFLLATKDPDYLNIADAYENAGTCALKGNNTHAAVQYFDQALMQDPERPESLIQLAQINFKAGKYKAARDKLAEFNRIARPRTDSIRLAEQIDSKLPRSSESVTVTDEAYNDTDAKLHQQL